MLISRELATLRDHARSMADDPEIPAGEVRLWVQIADEIDAYTPQPVEPEPEPAPVEEPALF